MNVVGTESGFVLGALMTGFVMIAGRFGVVWKARRNDGIYMRRLR